MKRADILAIQVDTICLINLLFIGKILKRKKSFSGTSGVVTLGSNTYSKFKRLFESGIEHHLGFTYGNFEKTPSVKMYTKNSNMNLKFQQLTNLFLPCPCH